ncbi:kelch-like 30 [Plakobranchus ocellatus]|uniref:Kelch-like 30 n=1 Tax=Plakobranchus ocellatus TaxID=259542 RepID=A0AAV4C3U1_9GAST|nr:kelch-like 30 [Plakobranchus ocellatus]
MDKPLNDADSRVRKSIFEGLINQKNNEKFHDVVVVAGSSEFKCHRVILASVSRFFHALFTSGMKECLESRVELKSISRDVFSQILDCIYNGRSILTTENIFDIWAAADILDARFLLEDCQICFKDTLSVKNCIEYCVRLRLLNEESKREALNFLSKNFKHLRSSERLFKLNFEEMKYLVSSEKLAASFEDEVIETILRWAESTPTLGDLSDTLSQEDGASLVTIGDNATSSKAQSLEDGKAEEETVCQDSEEQAEEVSVSRSERLAELLECSRYLLTSNSFLVQTLSCHPLVKGNARCLAVVDKISRYLSNTGLQQEWCPPEAIHRDGENVKNVFLIYNGSGKTKVMYPPSAQCYEMKYTFMNLNGFLQPASRIFYHSGSLLTLESGNKFFLYTAVANGWDRKLIAEVWEQHKTVLVDQSLYSFRKNTKNNATDVYKLRLPDIRNPHIHPCQWPIVGQLSVEGLSLKATTSIKTNIIAFWAGESSEGFTVECYDLFQRKSTVMKDRMGSTADLVTFRRDNEVFALQTNGALWRICLCSSSEKLLFIKEYQLWKGNVPLHGAYLYANHYNNNRGFQRVGQEKIKPSKFDLDERNLHLKTYCELLAVETKLMFPIGARRQTGIQRLKVSKKISRLKAAQRSIASC